MQTQQSLKYGVSVLQVSYKSHGLLRAYALSQSYHEQATRSLRLCRGIRQKPKQAPVSSSLLAHIRISGYRPTGTTVQLTMEHGCIRKKVIEEL